jgi:hypothetical protein
MDESDEDVREVFPITFNDGMKYIEGKRRLDGLM